MIDFQTMTVAERAREVFEQCKQSYEQDKQASVLLSHFGYFSQDLVNGFTEGVEEMLIAAGEKKALIKRVFSIMIEGLQNIRFHGDADEFGKYYGIFFITRSESQINICFGSLVETGTAQELLKRLDRLNEMEDAEVKDHYLDILSNGKLGVKGNAGLGFITMRMKSKSPLNYQMYELSEERVLFTLETVLRKEQNQVKKVI
ncbi:MAG: hypothetical protein EP338_07565 [Bacteroidetes bacterium]|nr:MAG: hypothetical protein EP338_07565 [Bacteroidota bacterium]